MATRQTYRAPVTDIVDFDALMARLQEQGEAAAPEAQPSKRTTARAAGDVGLALGQGAVGAFKSISDIFGADNAVSSTLGNVNEGLQNLKSDQSKATLANSQRRIQEAEATGDWKNEVAATMQMLWDQPAEMLAQGAGSFATLGIGKLAQAAKLTQAAKAAGVSKAVFLDSPAGREAAKAAAEFAFKANVAVGAGQGVGAVKGSQYEQTMNAARAQGMGDAEARALASEAQAYGGPGTMQQLLGGVLGAVASATGPIERMVAGKAVSSGPVTLMGGLGRGFATEGATEGAQGAQERYAGNDAAIDAGVLDESARWRGVAGQGVQEGVVGGLLGAGPGGLEAMGNKAQAAADAKTQAAAAAQAEADAAAAAIRANKQPGSGPLTNAVNAGTEADAQKVEVAGASAAATIASATDLADAAPSISSPEGSAEFINPDFQARQQTLAEQMTIPENREKVRARFGDDGLNQVLYYAQAAGRADIPAKTADNMLQVAERMMGEVLLQPLGGDAQLGGMVRDPLTLGAPEVAGAQPLGLGLDQTPSGRFTVDAQGNAMPETAVQRSDAQRRAGEISSLGSQKTDILNPSGQPFKTKFAAELAAKKTPGAVVPVVGGFVVRPAPAQAAAPTVPPVASAPAPTTPQTQQATPAPEAGPTNQGATNGQRQETLLKAEQPTGAAAMVSGAPVAAGNTGNTGNAAAGDTTKPERQYNLVAINEKTGKKTQLNATPLTHQQAVTMKSKNTEREGRRIQLEQIVQPSDTTKPGGFIEKAKKAAGKAAPAPVAAQQTEAETLDANQKNSGGGLPSPISSKKTYSALLPFNIQGNKTQLLANGMDAFLRNAAKGARRVIDAFGGAAAYTHALSHNGDLPTGSVYNEFEPLRYITNKQIKENVEQVIARLEFHIGKINAMLATSEEATAKRKLTADYVINGINSHKQDGVPEHAKGLKNPPSNMDDSPDLAALYLIAQNSRFGYRPIQSDVGEDGKLRVMSESENELVAIREGGEKVTLFGRGKDKLINSASNLRAASKRLQGVDVRMGDGWMIGAKEASAGDVLLVDTSYLNKTDKNTGKTVETANYNKATQEDAIPAVYKEKVTENLLPAWDRGAKIVITNNWNDDVAAYLKNLGFTVIQDQRAKGVSNDTRELIAINFNQRTGAVDSRRGVVSGGATGRSGKAIDIGGNGSLGQDGVRGLAAGAEGQNGAVPRSGRGRLNPSTGSGKADARNVALTSVVRNGGNSTAVLTDIAKNSTNPAFRLVAKAIMAKGLPFDLRIRTDFTDGKVAHYSTDGHFVEFDPSMPFNLEQVLLHEAVHAVTSKYVASFGDSTPLGKELAALFKLAEQHAKKTGAKFYGLTNADEFLAEVMTNADFAQWLDTVPVPLQKSALSRFVRAVARFFGIQKADGATAQAMDVFERIMLAQSDLQAEASQRLSTSKDAAAVADAYGVDTEDDGDTVYFGDADVSLNREDNTYIVTSENEFTPDHRAAVAWAENNGFTSELAKSPSSKLTPVESMLRDALEATGDMGAAKDMAYEALRRQGVAVKWQEVVDAAKKMGRGTRASKPEADAGRTDTTESPRTPASTIRSAITKAYGNLLDKLEAKGLVMIAQTEREAIEAAAQARADKTGGDVGAIAGRMMSMAGLDVKYSANGNIEGFFDRQTGKSFLVADNLTAASAPGTLMHEVGIHMAADGRLEPLFKRAGSLLKTGTQNEFIQRVKARMARAGETSDEEAAAYIVTEYENDRAKAPITIGKWLADLTAAVRAWLFDKGVILKAEQLTVADIAAVARANARSMARGGPNGGPGGGIRRSFAGEGAATADKMALATARQRVEAGENAETVRKDTGWFKGVDGKWRFEINDKKAKLLPKAMQQPGRLDRATEYLRSTYGVTYDIVSPKVTDEQMSASLRWADENKGGVLLDEAIQHDALFAAYPSLRNMRVSITSDPKFHGTYSKETNTITISQGRINEDGREDRVLSTLLHEIQHGIQNIEGFATGGTPKNMAKMLDKEKFEAMVAKDDALTAEFEALKKKYSGIADNDLPKGVSEKVRQLRSEINAVRNTGWREATNPFSRGQYTDDELFAGYRRLAGEVEARNTQARQGMTDSQRRAKAPSKTADTPDSDVIVVFNGKDAMSAPAPANADPDIRFSRAADMAGNAIDKAKQTADKAMGKDFPRAASMPDLNDDQRSLLGKVGASQSPASDAIKAATDRAGLKIRQGMVDRFAALKELDEKALGKDFIGSAITDSAWVLAKMSSAGSGALNAMMKSGRIEMDAQQKVIGLKGAPNGGLTASLQKLGGPAEVERFFAWVAANRAEKLMGEGRENLFTPAEIAAGKTLNTGTTEEGKVRPALYSQVHAEFQQYRDDVLAIAEQTGIINSENRAMWRDEFYVPFYRVMEDDADSGRSGGNGLSRQEAYKRLKGGKQNLNDLMENTLMNFHHLLSASLKNQAAVQAIKNAEAVGIARKVPEARRDTKTSTFVLVDGKKVFYEVDDPLVFESITTLADPGLNNTAVRVMGAFKRVFTNMTTATPQFIIANTFRDLLQASATSPTSKNIAKNLKEGIQSYRDEKTRAEMLASGGAFSFGHIYGMSADEVKESLQKTVAGAGLISSPSMIPSMMRKMWDAWGNITDLSENASRAATYAQNVDQMGKLRAAFEARDVMDFSQHGAWPAVRLLVRIVPFLNARLQGLDKLYRSGLKPSILTAMSKGTDTDKQAAARFAMVTGALTLATMALYLANADDDEYKKLEEWQKDTYWFIRIGENAFFLPKPFEVGAIATMAERTLQQAMDDKATGKLFRERMWEMLMQTFAFNPTPQMFQPLIDVYTNKDAFTGRDIESAGMERMSTGLRSRDTTTAPATALSAVSRVFGDESAIAVSPVQADHLIKGYLGGVGATAAGWIDTMYRAATGQSSPDKAWSEYQPIRRFYRDLDVPVANTRYTTLFYDGLKEANRVYADVMELQKLGRTEEAQALATEKRSVLQMRIALNAQQRRLTEINNRMKEVRRSDKDGEWKRRELDLLTTQKALITERLGKRIEDARAQ